MRPFLPAVPLLALACTLAVSSATPAPSLSAGPRMVLPFIRDDYPRALAEARARKVPLFIEAWAPW
jgi:hypothetical protein